MKKIYPISSFTRQGVFVLFMLMLGLNINLHAQYEYPITVTIIGHTMETDYNRLEQHVSGYDVIIDDNNDHVFTIADIMFIGGEEDSIARGTNANNTYYMNLEGNFQVKAPYYFTNVQIEVTNGSLTINPKHVDVTITGKTKTITYDGTQHEFGGTQDDYEIVISPSDAGYPVDTLEHRFVQFQSVTGTNKGSYTGNVVLLPPTDAGNYVETISVEDYALLEIEQAALTITAKDQTYPYTGSPQGPGDILIVDDFDQYLTLTDLQGADELKSIELDGQATDVGPHPDALVLSNAVIRNADGYRVEDNYDITYVNGSITITSAVPDCDGVVDYGGYSYETVQIGTQCWLTENLRIAEDAAGNEIGTPLFDDEANVGKFGLLYTWYEAMGVEEGETPAAAEFVQGICPEGWHIPSHADFMVLKSVVDGNVQYLRDKDPLHQYWIESAHGLEPNYGFQSRGSGRYNSTSGYYEEYMVREHYWESTSNPGSTLVEVAGVTYFCDEIMLETSSRNDKRSVRCLRDLPVEIPSDDSGDDEPGDDVLSCGTMTDASGNNYETVQLGNQCWTKTNLRVAPAGATDATSSGAYSNTEPYYYVKPGVDAATYGYYYNWEAAKLACPSGWHLPSDAEWTQLTEYVGGQSDYVCGGNTSYIAKALASETGWNSYAGECNPGDQSTYANNATGFSAVPAGRCFGSSFNGAGNYATFWSSTEDSSNFAWYRRLYYYDADVGRNDNGKVNGFSVRCLRDE